MNYSFEPRIYRLVLYIDGSRPWSLQRLCEDLCVIPEQENLIREDQWGIRGVLELWFQEIEGGSLTFHIQKKHSTRKDRYLKDLEEFFCDLDNLDYIKNYEEISYNR